MLGERADLIERDTPVALNAVSTLQQSALAIAREELNKHCMPLTIRRFLSDGSFEEFHVNELIGKC